MTELNMKIEELMQKGASDFEVAKVIKIRVKEYLNSLDEIFEQTSGKDFFVKHTKMIDKFIKIIYQYILRKHFGIYIPISNSIPIIIVALGSYGREQLCVYSDIDIMLLYENVSGFNITPIIEEFMILSWDSGLKLGSRVHTLDDINNSVNSDITIKTAILESRLIYGSKHLWYKFNISLQTIKEYNKKEFVLEKLIEHKKRLEKYPLNMQPNIKDGYGGMRESNTLFWLATISFDISNNKELIGVLFNDIEYKKYRTSLEYIFKIRNALHLISKKKQDTVLFELLPELSKKLGFISKNKIPAERLCSSKIFEALHNIHFFTAIMIKKITRIYIFEKQNISLLFKKRIEKNIYICNNKVYSSYYNSPKKLSSFLKEILLLPNSIKEFDISYIYYASKTIVSQKQTQNIRNLISLILQKENLYLLIDLLYKSMLLQQIIPIFKKVINQPQFDGYHKHPVDIHIINALYFIDNIGDVFIKNIFDNLTIKQKIILRLAVLFHDIGKGRSKDHHIAGAKLFKKFISSLYIEDYIIQNVFIIIKYHNIMSKVAQTEDIYEQNTILSFSGMIPSKELLDILIVLTYADINSVDSKFYKSSTSSLLKELYLQTLPAYDNVELLTVSKRRTSKENTIKSNKLFIEQKRVLQKKILGIKSNQIFLKYKALDIIKISIRAKETNNWTYKIYNDTNLKISIIRKIPLNLGFLLGKLNFFNINKLGIYMLFDDKKFFEIEFDEKANQDDISFIEYIINEAFDMTKDIKIKKPFINRSEIEINCNHTDELAMLKIDVKDQKGLFSYIAKILDDFNIEINSAKIQSHNKRAKDMLLIDKNGFFCSNKVQILEQIITSSKI